MAEIEEYISSGILELYVYGALSDKESREVTAVLREYPEVEKEVEEIEDALQKLAAGIAPYNPEALLSTLKSKLSSRTPVRQLSPESSQRTRWVSYIGWAASLVFLIGLFFLFQQNSELRRSLTEAETKNSIIEQQIADIRDEAENTKQILAAIRDNNISRIPLQGQEGFSEAYATVYWNDIDDTAYIDAKGLPEPPRGQVYQVWSLTMQPLTPTSLGLLDDFAGDENKIFSLENANQSEAFGITLEPEGGSETPTMDQLYVLGTVAAP
ncbi:anti-sigma factor [Zunongwangia endophytica]|uniref:Anti-sigma factor n=1 Tax=Zunongwangia endophytica TaxID=1808945 RepID=A0ABV8HAJ7_9FLAO|nr:anti-sigma factor [Zunongwangia endophytica]MDN3593805.1 anti-sigma factor [Zunongwangia endophytica]